MTDSALIDRFVIENMPPADQWPEFLFETPELQFPARLNATVALLDSAINEGHGGRLAIIGRNIRWTYADFADKVNRLANLLVNELGLVPGNRVLLRGYNSPWFAVSWLAVWKAGGVAVGTMPLLRAKELKQIIDLSKATHALCEAGLADDLLSAEAALGVTLKTGFYGAEAFETLVKAQPSTFTAVDTAADDPALIAFTSGTTGVPKGCIHSHRDVMSMCEIFPRHCLKPGPDDCFIGTPPLAFTFGLGGLLCFPLWARASTVLLEKLAPEPLMAAIAEHKATICFTSPTAYRAITNMLARKDLPLLQHDLSSLKKAVSAGEALPMATREAFEAATGIPLYDGIGGTEMIHIYLASTPDNYRPGALGLPLPGYTCMLVDENMNPVPPGKEGKLAIKGPTGCRYLADSRQTNYVRNGWNITGDAYHQDEDGYYYYHARVDDIIVTSGYNVSSPEVESVLLEHPAVAETGVIGVPDPERGQILKAFVVLKAGFTGDAALVKALQDYVKQTAAPYKYPREVAFVDVLPRTETGKLQRFRLKDLP
jgi:2-aminobenzoate-CoA ligase